MHNAGMKVTGISHRSNCMMVFLSCTPPTTGAQTQRSRGEISPLKATSPVLTFYKFPYGRTQFKMKIIKMSTFYFIFKFELYLSRAY